MCKSHAEGGKRCAADTRPGFQSTIAQIAAAPSEQARNEVRSAGTEAVVSHASTRGGAKEVAELRESAARSGDVAQQWWLQHCEDRGAQQREVDQMIEQQIRARNEERAAAQTRPAYEAGVARLASTTGERARNIARMDYMSSVVSHAATKVGAREVAAWREEASRSGDFTQERWLKRCELKAAQGQPVQSQQAVAEVRRVAPPRLPTRPAEPVVVRSASTTSTLGSWGDYVPASSQH